MLSLGTPEALGSWPGSGASGTEAFATLFGYFFPNVTSEGGKSLPKHEVILSLSIALGGRLGVQRAKAVLAGLR